MSGKASVRIGVFGLFHPQEFAVQPAGWPIRVNRPGSPRILEGTQRALVHAGARITGADGGPVDIELSVPHRIRRCYRGIIRILPGERELTAVVEMDREIAVASIVGAEIAPGAPLEALKAQAVATRSFLAASAPRHPLFDFCDTTHCQFLRAWPPPGSDPYRAALDTVDLQLTYEGLPFAARYSAVCGGRTLALDAPGYRYRAVACPYCRPPVRGHRLGLCQQGASGMAGAGATFRQILDHYYPAARIAKP